MMSLIECILRATFRQLDLEEVSNETHKRLDMVDVADLSFECLNLLPTLKELLFLLWE